MPQRRKKNTQEVPAERKATQKRTRKNSDADQEAVHDNTTGAAKGISGRRTETVVDPHISYILNKDILLEKFNKDEVWQTRLYLSVDEEFYIELFGEKFTLSAEQVHKVRTQTCQHTECKVVGHHQAHEILAHDNMDLDDIPPFAYSETMGPLKNPKVPKATDILEFFNDFDKLDAMDAQTIKEQSIQVVKPCKQGVPDDWQMVKDNKAYYVGHFKRVVASAPMPVAYDLPPGTKLTTEAMQMRWSKTQHAARDEIHQLLMRKRLEGQKQYGIARIHQIIDEVIESHENQEMKVPVACGPAAVSQMTCSERLYLIMRALRTAEAAKYDLLMGVIAELITSPTVIPHRKLSNARNNAGKQADNQEAKEAKGVKKASEDVIVGIRPRKFPMSLTFMEQFLGTVEYMDDVGSTQHDEPREATKKRKATEYEEDESYQPAGNHERKILPPKRKKQKADPPAHYGSASQQEDNDAGMFEAGDISQTVSQAPSQYTTAGATDLTATDTLSGGFVQNTPYFPRSTASTHHYPDPQVTPHYAQAPPSSTHQYPPSADWDGLQLLDQYNQQHSGPAVVPPQLHLKQQQSTARMQGRGNLNLQSAASVQGRDNLNHVQSTSNIQNNNVDHHGLSDLVQSQGTLAWDPNQHNFNYLMNNGNDNDTNWYHRSGTP